MSDTAVQLTLPISANLRQAVKAAATKAGLSLKDYVADLLQKATAKK